MLKIVNIEEESIGKLLGLSIGDSIIAFDNKEVVDVLDYAYFDSMDKFTMTIKKVNGDIKTFDVIKDDTIQLGLDFEEACYLSPKHCSNNCMFCFVNQLPKNMRDTLYVKDDDWRLSFVSGNYVTFTNVNDEEIERIIEKRFFPLYISVHCTDEDIRRKMLGRINAPPIMPIIKRFAKADFTMHTQIVLCPNINDGDVLAKSLEDLFEYYPQLNSVAIVPVGLTQFRDGLSHIEAVNEDNANKVIDIVEEFAAKCNLINNTNFAYCSDEMYIKAKRPMPDYDYYGDFEQIENGVGLVAKFNNEWNQVCQDSPFAAASHVSYTIVTGESAFEFMSDCIDFFNKRYNANINVKMINNDFFGHSITVAGLIVGQDIIDQLRGQQLNDIVLIPKCMLKEFDNVFLDGTTIEQLSMGIGRKVEVVEVDGYELFNKLTICFDDEIRGEND